jgi:tetratricopeptide (TPR) repeat protein
MTPDRIIKYVHRNYKTYWQIACQLDRAKFETLLVEVPLLAALSALENAFGMQLPRSGGSHSADAPSLATHARPVPKARLSDVDFNRLTSGVTPKRLVPLLSNLETQLNIERALNCPGLFGCSGEAQIESLLNAILLPSATMPQAGRVSALVVVPEPVNVASLGLSAREERVIKSLLSLVTAHRCGVVCWKDAPTVGAALLAYVLAGTYLPKEGITSAYLLRPYPAYTGDLGAEPPETMDSAPFEKALKELRVTLGLLPHASASRILDEIRAKRAVLFILNASLMPESGSSEVTELRELVKAAADQFDPNACPVSIVLVGEPRIRLHPSKVAIAADMQQDLAFGLSTTKERSEFLELQWQRFCMLRGHLPSDEQGTRLKRAREYYSRNGDAAVLPATIRMLALFASNYATFSYFDPTAGWRRMVGLARERWPIDVQLHLDEVYAQICNVPGGHAGMPMRAIQWCSTALYWLTDDAAAALCKEVRPLTRPESFDAAVERVPYLIDIERDEQGRRVYKMDLALRALVQDLWAARDPHKRASAHFVIANRLLGLQNDKQTLGIEFPIAPHWGRSRMHFLAECVRHYIRAGDVSGKRESAVDAQRPFTEVEPEPPLSDAGCDPQQVVNYCFASIFWQELNANKRTGTVHNRKLSHQHGNYQLTAELLELLSEDGQLGRPHWGLSRHYQSRYHREVTYAHLDLGNLPAALQSVDTLIRLSSADGSVTAFNVDDHLDRAVVLTSMNALDEAEQIVETVRQCLRASAAPATAEERRTRSKIDFRLSARAAQLHYLRDDHASALEIYDQLAARSPGSIRRDIAHTYIATLGAIGGETCLQRAMTLCVLNVFDNTSRGQHHSALGFRVALGHLFRKSGMNGVAEATLDQVQADILQFGCSERTYLALLLEAGRIVSLKPSGCARAYAAYLRPCYDRSRSCGYARTARIAREAARLCRTQLLAMFDAAEGATLPDVETMLGGSSHWPLASVHTDIDPRYALGSDLSERWLPKLQTRAAIEQQLQEIAAVAD